MNCMNCGAFLTDRDLDYCPHCGAQMDAFPDCAECEDAHCGEWCENGICFACRENAWITGRKHRKSLIEEA